MSTPFAEIAGLDRLVHEPTRLAILTALPTTAPAELASELGDRARLAAA